MVTDAHPLNWKIGLVGYGEVGRILAEDLHELGVAVCAYDIKLGGTAAAPLVAHAERFGVALKASHAELARQADLIVSAVTADQTLAAAEACAPHQAHTYFLDLNSASPWVKCRAAECLSDAGGSYVEGAVMTSVPPHRIGVPLLLGGPHAQALAKPLARLGFNPKVADTRLGIASATKMCRSVVIKGLEAIIIESLTAARSFGVENEVLASLAETFPGINWEQQANYMFGRVIAHGQRRADEMREAAKTVSEAGLVPWSATSSVELQAWMAALTDKGCFGKRSDPAFARSPDWRIEADRILAHNCKTTKENR
jgi:3-hydroxyisobutyrate dehydrogenase-like beta-hydroxyacid dehydrogenase